MADALQKTGRSRLSPVKLMMISVFWIVLSALWIDFSFNRISGLRAAGRPVSEMRYVTLGFWILMLIFWCFFTWKSYRRYRAARAESR